MSLSVVYVQETGHVVGALAVTGGAPPADVASIVGTELPMRTSLETGLVLKVGQLAVAPVDDEPAVFFDPLTFGVGKPALRQLAPWSAPLPLTESALTITLAGPVPEDTPVVVMIDDDLFTMKIAKGKDFVIAPMALEQGGIHPVLVLVAGQVGRLEELTVTP